MPYVITEWAPGGHLDDLLSAGLLSLALAAAIIADAADALAVAHDTGRPHCAWFRDPCAGAPAA
jgi:hypothetical protein